MIVSDPVRINRETTLLSNQFIEKAISSNEDVLVHCAKGKSRSATIILAFMMYKYKLQHNKALVYVKRKRN